MKILNHILEGFIPIMGLTRIIEGHAVRMAAEETVADAIVVLSGGV